MTNVKLNMLHVQYLGCEDARSRNDVFAEIYALTKRARDINRSQVTTSGYGDEADAQTIFDDVIVKMLRDSRITDFERTLNRRLKTKRIDLLRGTSRRRTRQCSLEELIEGAPTPATLQVSGIDKEVFHRKKETDQRQLIDFLLRSAKTDATTTTIVEAFLIAPLSASPNAIAKSIGLHHETVNRKLLSLGRRYDANRFGDRREYLAI